MSVIPKSRKAERTFNPIRNIVDTLRPPVDHPDPFLNLALGDPTAHGLKPPQVLIDAMHKQLDLGDFNGYLPSVGEPKARKAIATYASRSGYEIDADDVVICSGCSGSVELVISALIDEGDNILVPSPGFPLYQVIINSLGGLSRHYDLIPEKSWECDLNSMKRLIDNRTKAILINNPSNPCGAVYSKEHLKEIAKIAREYNLPIIADEIYSGIVFDSVQFHPMSTCAGDVPVISMGGLAKEFVCPGWRVGWITLHDKTANNRLSVIRSGLKSLTQLIVGANSLVQACIPDVLCPIENENEKSLTTYNKEYCQLLESNSNEIINSLKGYDLLTVVEPQGAMYAMVKISFNKMNHTIKNDKDFAKELLNEENLIVLPGACFGLDDFVRVLTCPSLDTVKEAIVRMKRFCEKRRLPSCSPKDHKSKSKEEGKVENGSKRKHHET
jgi:tyrosine aminotransferase